MTDAKGPTRTEMGGTSSPEATSPPEPEARTVTARRGRVTRLGSIHAGLVIAAAVLVLLLVFILENSHSVNVAFLGAHLRLPLAVALLLAGVGGALLVGAIGAARITQLRRTVRHEVHRFDDQR